MTPAAESLRDAVVQRRGRWGPLTFERWGVEAARVQEAQARAGWAAHVAPSFSSAAQALAMAAMRRANDEAGTRVHSTELYQSVVRCAFDGYELGCALTGAGGDGNGGSINSGGATTAFANRAMKQLAALDGVLAEACALLFAERLSDVPADQREVATLMFRLGMGGGLLLHQSETGAKHPLLEALLRKAPKAKREKEPEARVAPPNDALLDAILAAPHDDGPRLVYADWLTEHGDPRGEFIQLQCTLGRTLLGAGAKHATPLANDALGTHSVDDLKEREARLIKRHEKQWRTEVPALRNWYWRRGFIFAGIADFKQFAAALPLLQRAPLERVQLTGFKAGDAAGLLKAPAHPTVDCVDLSSSRLTARSAGVLRAPLLTNVKRLSLSGNDLSRADTMRVVVDALDAMPKLTHLYLGYSKLTDDTLALLAESATFSRLQALDVFHTDLSVGALSVFERATSLNYLSISPVLVGRREQEGPFYEALTRVAPTSLQQLATPHLPPKLLQHVSERFTPVKQHHALFFDMGW